jgi:hypothetical protein
VVNALRMLALNLRRRIVSAVVHVRRAVPRWRHIGAARWVIRRLGRDRADLLLLIMHGLRGHLPILPRLLE